jgi:hypothetical protein
MAVVVADPSPPLSDPVGHEEFAVPRRGASGSAAEAVERIDYTQVEIVEAITRWVFLYQEAPRMIDWDPSRARRSGQAWRAERFESGRWPSARIVTRRFPSFNAALEAAGVKPRPAPSRNRPNLTGPQAILDAMIEWTARYGDIPTMADWDTARALRLGQEWRIGRYHQGDWPSARSVAAHFGSFANAATAAGLVARRRSGHHDRRADEQARNRRVAATRARGCPPGRDDLAAALRALASARSRQDPVALHKTLLDVAGAALAWAELFGSD